MLTIYKNNKLNSVYFLKHYGGKNIQQGQLCKEILYLNGTE